MAIKMRYDIELSDFKDNDGTVSYIQMMATTLGVGEEKIIINSVEAGSVNIDSGVQLTASGTDAASIAATQSIMNTMNDALDSADKAGTLAIMDVPVLAFVSKVEEPQITGVSTSSSKKNVGLIVGLTIGLIALAAGLAGAGWFFYKRAKANRGVNTNAKTGGYSNVAAVSPVSKNEDMERILSTTPVGLKSEGAATPSS